MIWRTITLASIGVTFGTLGYLAADRDVPVLVYERAMVDDVVNPGATGRVRYRFKRSKSCETFVERSVTTRNPANGDIERFIVPPMHFSPGILPLGEDVATVPFVLSPEAKPGWEGTYRTVNCYACNITQSWQSTRTCDLPRDVPFKVGHSPKSEPEAQPGRDRSP